MKKSDTQHHGGYLIRQTRTGFHIVIRGDNYEPVVTGEPLTTKQSVHTALLAIGRMHSPHHRAELTAAKDGLMVWWGLGETPFHVVPVDWSDDRKPTVAGRALAAITRRTVGVPRPVVERSILVTSYEPVLNGDSHDA